MTPQQELSYSQWVAQQRAQQAKAPQGGSGAASIIPAAYGAYKLGSAASKLLSGGASNTSPIDLTPPGGVMKIPSLNPESPTAGSDISSTGVGATKAAGFLDQMTTAGKYNPFSDKFGSGAVNPFSSTDMGSNIIPGLQVAGGGYMALNQLGQKSSLGGGLKGTAGAFTAGQPFGLGPEAAAAYAAVYGGKALYNHFFHHETTRETEGKNTARLQGMGQGDQAWQNYVKGMRAQYSAPPPDPSKPFDGKYGSWDEYKKAGLDAKDLTGVYGNMSTFGPDWAKYSQDQRQKITQALIDNNLYDSKKGDVIVNNSDLARKLGADVLAGKLAIPASPSPQTTPMANNKVGQQMAPFSNDMAKNDTGFNLDPNWLKNNAQFAGGVPSMAQAMTNVYAGGPKRSQTLSPGIGMNGQRINYGRR